MNLTQIFARPLRGLEFFEEVIRDNLDLGRSDRVQLVFNRVVTRTHRPALEIMDGAEGQADCC